MRWADSADAQVKADIPPFSLKPNQIPLINSIPVTTVPLTKEAVLSQFTGCFKGIVHFPGPLYKFDHEAETILQTTVFKKGLAAALI